MRKVRERIGVLLLALVLCLTFLPVVPAYAGDGLENAGPNITVGVGGDPVGLDLTGYGPMYDFFGETPWDDWKSSIEEIYVGDGITYIGANAFTDMPNLKEIWIPAVNEIHPDAFKNCPKLKTVYYRRYRSDMEQLIEAIPAGPARPILSAATWQCIDQGTTYTLRLSDFNGDELPFLHVTDYRINQMIDTYFAYLWENGAFATDPKGDGVHVNCDFGKDGTYDLCVNRNSGSEYYDYSYLAIKGGTTGTLASMKITESRNVALYDKGCPFYGRIKIVVPTELKASNLSLSTVNYPWTGSYIKPAVTVKANGKTLKKDTDYTVTYKNNKAIGKATITVKGKGDYYGTATKRFNIVKAANPMTVTVHAKGIKYTTLAKGNVTVKKADVFTVKNNKGKVTFTKASGNSKIVVSSAGNITVKKGLKKGTYKVKVKVKAAGTSTYKAKTLTRTITIKVK